MFNVYAYYSIVDILGNGKLGSTWKIIFVLESQDE